MKSFLGVLFCCVLTCMLCSCGAAVPLSERAIIKGVYLDEQEGTVQAGLVIYTCEPSANTADVAGNAKICTGEGDSIASAIRAAEEKQNKKPFYAQNRLLLLGMGAAGNATQYLSYFCAEEVSRTDVSVFLTAATLDDFKNSTDAISDIVSEGERLTDETTDSGNQTRRIHEMRFDAQNKFYGYLPLLQTGQEGSIGVSRLLIYAQGKPTYLLEKTQLQLALLLSGKTNRLQVEWKKNGNETVLRTQRLFLQRETGEDGSLVILICGKAESLTQNGRTLQGNEQSEALEQCNAYLTAAAEQLMSVTEDKGNDIFSCNWWTQAAYGTNCKAVSVQSRIKIA